MAEPSATSAHQDPCSLRKRVGPNFKRIGYSVTPAVLDLVGETIGTMVNGIVQGVFPNYPTATSTTPWVGDESGDDPTGRQVLQPGGMRATVLSVGTAALAVVASEVARQVGKPVALKNHRRPTSLPT